MNENSAQAHIKYFAFSPWRREQLQQNSESESNSEDSRDKIPQLNYSANLYTDREGALKEMKEYIVTQRKRYVDVKQRFEQAQVLFVSNPDKAALERVEAHINGISIDTNVITLYPGDKYRKWGDGPATQATIYTIK